MKTLFAIAGFALGFLLIAEAGFALPRASSVVQPQPSSSWGSGATSSMESWSAERARAATMTMMTPMATITRRRRPRIPATS